MPLPLTSIFGGMLGAFSLSAIKYLLPFIIASLIKILGISLVTFIGLEVLTDSISDYLLSHFNSLGSDIIAILKIAGFLDAVNILIAGWAAQIQLKQILGAFSKFKVQSQPGPYTYL